MKNELNLLRKENKLREEFLSDIDRKAITRMLSYINMPKISCFEAEVMRKELIGMALEAEQRGEALIDVIGEDEKAFCDEMRRSGSERQVKEQMINGFYRVSSFFMIYVIITPLMYWGSIPISVNVLVFLPVWSILGLMIDCYIKPRCIYEIGVKKLLPIIFQSAAFIILILCVGFSSREVLFYINQWIAVVVVGVIWLISKITYDSYIHKISKKYSWQN